MCKGKIVSVKPGTKVLRIREIAVWFLTNMRLLCKNVILSLFKVMPKILCIFSFLLPLYFGKVRQKKGLQDKTSFMRWIFKGDFSDSAHLSLYKNLLTGLYVDTSRLGILDFPAA